MSSLILFRRGTTDQWNAADADSRFLALGEPGYDTEAKVYKVGDGETSFANLPNVLNEDEVRNLISSDMLDESSEIGSALNNQVDMAVEASDIPGRVDAAISDSEVVQEAVTAAAAPAAETAVTAEVSNKNLLSGTDVRVPLLVDRDDLAWYVPDTMRRVAWNAVSQDGGPLPYAIIRLDELVPERAYNQTLPPEAGFAWTPIDDSRRSGWSAVGTDGGPTSYGLKRLAESGLVANVGPDGSVMPSTSLHDLAVFGDSTTRCSNHDGSGWPVLLAAQLGVALFNGGDSGTVMDQIAAHMGGITLHCYVSGGTIPADLTPVTLTSWDQKALGSVDIVTWDVILRLRDGTLIPGTLSQASGAMATVVFTRTTAGSAITTNGQVEVFSIVGKTYANRTIILAGGINDETLNFNLTTTPDHVLAGYSAAASVLTPLKPRLMVWGPLDRVGEVPGDGANGDFIAAVERGLRKMFGSNFCEVRKYLASSQALLDAVLVQPGFAATTADTNAVAAGNIPPSFHDPDGSVHLNLLGYLLQARYMARWLTSPIRKWY